jgi:hypothetical protein
MDSELTVGQKVPKARRHYYYLGGAWLSGIAGRGSLVKVADHDAADEQTATMDGNDVLANRCVQAASRWPPAGHSAPLGDGRDL